MREFRRRLARSTVTVLFLSIFTVVAGPVLAPQLSTQSAEATTPGIISTGLVLDVNATNSTDMAATSGSYPALTSTGGGYYDLNGTSQYIVPNTGTNLGTSNVVSIFMWVYPKGAGQLLAQQNGTTINTNYHTAIMEYTSGDQLHIGLWNGSDQTSVNLSSTIATPKNNWYLVGLVYDGSKINGYVNGVFAGSTSNFTYSPPASAYYGIGAYDVTNIVVPASYGNMRFGELSVYNTALSEADAQFNFNATVGRFGPTVSSPSNTSAYVNRFATFTSSACTNTTSGSSTCNYQWQLSTDSGSTWNFISGANTNTYTTPLLSSSFNGYRYRMYAWDPGTGTTPAQDLYTITAAATLTVSTPPGSDTDTALSLNGSNQYASVADTTGSPFDITGAFTMEAWVKPADSCGGSSAVISKYLSYMMYCQTGKWMYMLLASGTGTGAATSIAVEANTWHHLAYTKSAASGDLLIYYDGMLVQTIATGVTSITPNNQIFQIGQYTGSYYFNGQIDEVRLYASQRTQSQIAADMNTYGPIDDSNLAAYYDFNEGSGSTLYNREAGATSATDLAITGSPSWSDIKSVDTTTFSAYTVVKFPRTYLTSIGGWKAPSNVSKVSALVVAGGGGGGSRHAGGGGAGGLAYGAAYPVTAGGTYSVVIGMGGIGYGRPGNNVYLSGTTAVDNKAGPGGGMGTAGTNSRFLLATSSTDSITALGGGGGSGTSTTGAGGSGGGSNQSIPAGTKTQYSGANWVGYGNDGGQGSSGSCTSDWCGGGGGGAGEAGIAGNFNSSGKAGNGGAGLSFTLESTTPIFYAAGGGAGSKNATAGGGLGGSSIGGNGGIALAGTAGLNGTGSGGGGGGFNASNTDYAGGNGGSGVIIIRWITALKPTYTKPVNAYLNVGMTETFTTNVATDSTTAILTRTFRWESTTGGSNGTFSLIKQGTGAANASLSWVPTDTSTSGANYLYRLIVTDSDTAGLFITDSSTAFAVINRTLSMTGSSRINKAINVSKNETFTVSFGTSTYRVTLSPVIPGITLDTSTITSPVITIADTATVGTYYETLTVTDSVSASVVIPLTINIVPPPTLLNTAEIVSNDLVFSLDAGNSASLIGESGTATTGLTWKDISGSKANAATGAGVNTGAANGTTCTAPSYSSANGGALQFTAVSTNCYYASSFTGRSLANSYTVEAWFKTTSVLPQDAAIVSQSSTASNVPVSIFIQANASGNLIVGFGDNTVIADRFANCPYTPTIGRWTHISGTYDGTTVKTYIDGALSCSTNYSYTPNATLNNLGLIIGKGRLGGFASFPGFISTVRIYQKPLTAAQILSNYNATKARFDNSNIAFVAPTKKYGTSLIDSFTATSGSDTRTVSISTGNRNGIQWDTTTVASQIKLTLQESLTVGTYIDTITVADNLGQSTYLPMAMTVTVADSITITSGPSVTSVYTGSAPTSLPIPRVTGLVGFDTATVVNSYTSGAGTTCATGGTCAVGDTGPGGGIVFYVSASVIDSATGISDGGTYLEVAPKGWSTPGSEYSGQWAAAQTSVTGTSRSLGQGAENTRKIIAALPSTANLAKVTSDLTYGGKSDWFFPSTDEVRAMYTNLYAASLGDFSASNYWGSTQDDLNNQTGRAETYWFGSGNTYSPTDKLNSFVLRPVRAFSASSVTTTTPPTEVDTYTVRGSNITFNVGSLSNYAGVIYETSTVKITQAFQSKLTINYYGAVAGTPFTIITTGGSGTGAVTETVTAGSSATNCQVANHVLTNSNSATDQKYCRVIITKASSRNYFSESLTADVYFMVYINNQPTNQVGSGSTIALNGKTSLTIDDSSTVRVPRITGFSKSGSTLTINGEGFGSSQVTITFERYVNALTTPTPTLNGTLIVIAIPSGAISGPVLVITSGGRDSIEWLDIP